MFFIHVNVMRRHNVPALKTTFDETVFVTGGRSDFGTGPVFVSNRADKFILNTVFGVSTVDTCRASSSGAGLTTTTYSLNAPNPCADINVYSMNARHCSNRSGAFPHRTIRVMRNLSGESVQISPITCDFFAADVVYTDNRALTAFEMAIMLKFYSLQLANNAVTSDVNLKITTTLYHKCLPFFDGDSRIWFYFDKKHAVVANSRGEYIVNGSIVNFPRPDIVLKFEPRL